MREGGKVGFISFLQLNGRGSVHPDPTSPLLRAVEVRAWLDSQELLARAKSDAEEIRDSAQQTYDEYCRRGYADGLQRARLEEAERIVDVAGRTIDYLASLESEMVELVVTAMKKIFAEFDEYDRVLIVVRAALSALRKQKQMTLRAAPLQIAGIKKRLSDLLADHPNVEFIEVLPDERLSGDSCVLESEIGSVETSVDAQIEVLRKSLKGLLGTTKV